MLDTPEHFFQTLLASGRIWKGAQRMGTLTPAPIAGSQLAAPPSLQDGVATAQRSITLASLYIGTEGGRERQLVEALAAAAADASRPQLRIRILLDALRSTRPTRGPGGSTTSTAELLAEQVLLAAGQGAGTLAGSDASQPRAAVALFHTPSLRGLLKRVLPPRVREVVGVCHTKLYIFDDDVLLSGANLSNNYFTTRQDRCGWGWFGHWDAGRLQVDSQCLQVGR